MPDERKPHPKNAPGPFYIENGCCITCLAPHAQAPELMGFDDMEGHCFVAHQPQTEEELYRTIRAAWSSEVQCLRYKGNDPDIIRRLVEIGEGDTCDLPLPTNAVPILRNHVTFESDSAIDVWEVAMSFRNYIVSENSEHVRFKIVGPKRQGKVVRIDYAWYEDRYYTVNIERGELATDRWLVHHSQVWEAGSVSVSLMIDDWLRSDARFSDFRWYASDGWNVVGGDWQERPY